MVSEHRDLLLNVKRLQKVKAVQVSVPLP